ncbi:MAG: transposase [Candidatus Zixiibacteriota bacterium]
MSPADQTVTVREIISACKRHQIPLLAVNVLPDHVHMIVSAPSETELTEHVRKIKGSSASTLRAEHGLRSPHHVWARKFNRRAIRNEESLQQMIAYVLNNHLKHAERWGQTVVTTWEERIRPLVEAGCVDVAQIFR